MGILFVIGGVVAVFSVWGSYSIWRDRRGDREDYQRTFAGYLLCVLDGVVALTGAAATTYLLGGFGGEVRYIADAVFLVIKAGIMVLVAVGVLFLLIRERRTAGPKLAAYACVLVLVAAAFARAHYAEVARRSEPPKKHFVSRP